MDYKNKKNSSKEEQTKSDSIISQNTQKSNELSFFFAKDILKMADKKKLIELDRLAHEIPYKWCRDAVNAEWRRRAV